MKIFIIEHNSLWSDFQRENRERFCIKELRVLHPDELTEHNNCLMYIFFHSVYS